MTREQYIKITGFIREYPKRIRFVRCVDRILTAVIVVSYPVFLLWLLLEKNVFIVRAALVPAVSFFVLSAVRSRIHAPRPYEKFGIPPVLPKDTMGKSFPSRHVFSAFMIAMTFWVRFPWQGVAFGVCGVLIAVIRVAGGVHEPKDVIAGAFCGILCGVIGYFIF